MNILPCSSFASVVIVEHGGIVGVVARLIVQAGVADADGVVHGESLPAGADHIHLDAVLESGAATHFVAAAGEVFAYNHDRSPWGCWCFQGSGVSQMKATRRPILRRAIAYPRFFSRSGESSFRSYRPFYGTSPRLISELLWPF